MIKEIIFPISSLFVAIAFLATGYGMILTFVGVYLKDIGISSSIIGIINAAFFLGAVSSSVFSQKIISTVGHIRSFAAFASLLAVTFMLHSLYFDAFFWAFLRFVSGFCFYGLLIILESWLNEKSSEDDRGKILAIYVIIFYLATAIGQLFLTLDAQLRQYIFIIGSILVLFSVVIIALTKIKEPHLKAFEKYSMPKVFAIVPLATVSSFIAGYFVGGFFTMVPVYILIQNYSVEVVSYFMLITLLGGLMSQWPIGLLSDKYGRRRLIAFSGIFTAAISSALLFVTMNALLLYVLGFLLGLTLFCFYPLAVARANDVVDENKDIVEISRALLFVNGMGSFVAPLLIGFGLSFSAYFLFASFVLIGIFLFFYSLSKKRVADDDLSTFVSMPVASGSEFTEAYEN